MRDLFLGRRRFKEFAQSPEGIPTNILAERLERLAEHGVIQRITGEDGPTRPHYALTDKGQALAGVVRAMRDWGLAWEPGTKVLLAQK